VTPEALLWHPTRCSCAIWAMVMYARFRRAYGYRAVGIQCQPSQHLIRWLRWVPHFHVTLRLPGVYRVWGYDPLDETEKILPRPWFPGHVVEDT